MAVPPVGGMSRPMLAWARASTLTAARAHLLRMHAWQPGDGPSPQRQAAAGAAERESHRLRQRSGAG